MSKEELNGIDNFEYVEFYKEQLNHIRKENETLKQKNEITENKINNIKSDCKVLIGKICEENEMLREMILKNKNSFDESKIIINKRIKRKRRRT